MRYYRVVPGLHVPLMTIIDYRGFRIGLLERDKESCLREGERERGELTNLFFQVQAVYSQFVPTQFAMALMTLVTPSTGFLFLPFRFPPQFSHYPQEDAGLIDKMVKAANKLNIAKHRVCPRQRGRGSGLAAGKILHGPLDLEVCDNDNNDIMIMIIMITID